MSDQRRQQLEKNINDAYELIAEYEGNQLLASDPKEKRRIKREIDKAKQDLAEWETQLAALDGAKPENIPSARKRACPGPPSAPEVFRGRDEELAEMKRRLIAGQDGIITAVQGVGGLGKTTLARQMAHDLFYKEKAFGAVLWADLGREVNPLQLLLTWAYHAEPGFQPSGLPLTALAAQVKAKLEDLLDECHPDRPVRTLVVLDDVWDRKESLEAAKLLREASPAGSVWLLTSRSRQVVVRLGAGATDLPLQRLTDEQGAALLQYYLPQAETALLKDLSRTLGGHPLALTLAAKRVQLDANPATALTRHLKQYHGGQALPHLKLAEAETREENLELVFSYSYDELKPDDQARFRTLGALTYDQSFDLPMLTALWHCDEAATEKFCDTLRLRSLLEVATDQPEASHQDLPIINHQSSIVNREDWYSLHPLLHSYAQHLHASDLQRDEISRRYEDHIITVAEQFRKLPPEEWQVLDLYLPHIHTVGDGLVEPTKDSDAVEALLHRALDFALNTRNYLYRRREVRRLEWLEMGLDVSRRLQDQKREALFLNDLGLSYSDWGDKKKALEYYEQALFIDRELGNKSEEATILVNIGAVYFTLGENGKALNYFEQALPLLRQVGDKGGEAVTLNNIGRVYDALRDKDRALEYYKQALPLRRRLGDKGGEATTLNNIGAIYDGLGDKDRALEYYKQALPLRRQVGDKGGEAVTLNNIGLIYSDLGEKGKALEYYEQALPLVREVGDKDGESITSYNIGSIYYYWDQLEEAIQWMVRCVELDEQVQHPDLESDRALLTEWQAELAQKMQEGKENEDGERRTEDGEK